ncbi:MAG: beta galactosidase jelly roll domain-containing protein [Planctomycetes bacterium]|nr:beta galactosidase jelly roll domain-containing protein [Planctomycetota bacterium]MBL7038404.1 beta galactosidase jelly roll domain-containing protein [Pirellulaceae bacterium]
MRYLKIAAFFCFSFQAALTVAAEWKPAESTLMTRWAKNVSPDNAHSEYPRPQMVRKDWLNLNGLWEYAICAKDDPQPKEFDGKILVPFPVESALSGVKEAVTPEDRLWYRRTFAVPEFAQGQRLLLHFQAVDWHAQVSVNGRQVGEHKGGYDPFTFDITDALTDAAEQEIVVSVWDPTNKGPQPRGKQVLEPRGIWYTAVTGIWQTVWLEAVPETYVRSLKIVPDLDANCLRLTVTTDGDAEVWAKAFDGEQPIASAEGKTGKTLALAIESPKLWSPDSPFLYDLRVGVQDGDEVASYFGMRKIEVKKDEAGVNRLFLNNEALFQIGPLDQGWWPDGLYTAATDDALVYDVEITKKLGFNMARKHVKVEPERWYYHCDRLGLLVWQDMPSGGGAGEPVGDGTKFPRSAFELEWKRVITAFHNHPSIVMWVPFNEGWGQHETPAIVEATKQLDPTRPVNEASGWSDEGSGDVKDIHKYPGPAMPPVEEKRVGVLGEFGGLGLPVRGHLWWDKRNWGYRNLTSLEQLQTDYDNLIQRLRPMIGKGLAAAVYTQTSDCEGEVNGLMTYDREVVKFDLEHMHAVHAPLFLPPPIIITKVIVPTSVKEPQTWRYTTDEPKDGWQTPDFDDSSWKEAIGGFGRADTPGAVIRTEWHSDDIWLRRTFQLKNTDWNNVQLRIHHDEDVEVYLNGKHIASYTDFLTEYTDLPLNKDAQAALRVGKNTLAVHCRQTRGGQYIDVGLVDVIEKPRSSP